jgi:hypothetical protein
VRVDSVRVVIVRIELERKWLQRQRYRRGQKDRLKCRYSSQLVRGLVS